MSSYASLEVDVTHHAYLQYCERVDKITGEELSNHCQQQLSEGHFSKGQGWFIEIGGVWWIYQIKENKMTLITCYGRTSMNLPQALKWAKRHNDRIDLQQLISPRPEVHP